MAATGKNPISLSVASDRYAKSAKIAAVIWEGATTSGDTAEIVENTTGFTLWKGRTDTTVTYLGIVFDAGIPADGGFSLSQISSGRVLVYLKDVL